MALALFLLGALQEGIGLPRGLITAKEEIGQTEGIVERLGGGLQLGTSIRVLHLNDPGGSHRLDSEPAWLPRLTVFVFDDAAVRDKRSQLSENVALDGGQVSRGPLRRLLSHLNPFHRKLRGGPDKKPVDGKAPSCPNRPGVKTPKWDEADRDHVPLG